MRRRATGKVYAMKVLRKSDIRSRGQIEHSKTERTLLERLDSPFVVKLRYAFQTSRNLYLLIDYCPGGELYYHLTKSGPFQEHKMRFYACQIIAAVEYLHDRNVVYRDLKPGTCLYILYMRPKHSISFHFIISRFLKHVLFSLSLCDCYEADTTQLTHS